MRMPSSSASGSASARRAIGRSSEERARSRRRLRHAREAAGKHAGDGSQPIAPEGRPFLPPRTGQTGVDKGARQREIDCRAPPATRTRSQEAPSRKEPSSLLSTSADVGPRSRARAAAPQFRSDPHRRRRRRPGRPCRRRAPTRRGRRREPAARRDSRRRFRRRQPQGESTTRGRMIERRRPTTLSRNRLRARRSGTLLLRRRSPGQTRAATRSQSVATIAAGTSRSKKNALAGGSFRGAAVACGSRPIPGDGGWKEKNASPSCVAPMSLARNPALGRWISRWAATILTIGRSWTPSAAADISGSWIHPPAPAVRGSGVSARGTGRPDRRGGRSLAAPRGTTSDSWDLRAQIVARRTSSSRRTRGTPCCMSGNPRRRFPSNARWRAIPRTSTRAHTSDTPCAGQEGTRGGRTRSR